MAQRAEIDLNLEDGGFAFRPVGRNNQIRQTQFPMGLPRKRTHMAALLFIDTDSM
jgi:hypothetical protein